MRTLHPFFELGFSIFPYCLAVQNGQKVKVLDIVCYQIYRTFFSGIQGCDELRQFVIVLVSEIFRVTVTYFFQGSFCTCSKFSLSLLHCSLNLYSFSFAKFFNLFSSFCSFVNPISFGSILFCNHTQK